VKAQLINEINDMDTDDSAETECLSAKIQLDDCEHADMSEFAAENRDLFDLVRNQELLLGLAYIYPKDKRVFKLFPNVLKIDCTSGTNNEKRPLLTMTVMDQNARSWIIFRALLPNERAWTFKWIFQEVLPNMLGMEFLKQVQVIITDGDSQETTQLDLAIKKIAPHVTRLRCGWHIIDRGWNAHGPKSNAAPLHKKEEWAIVLRVIQKWMYSWMRPGYCESEEELNISKALFVAYIKSKV
jgi:hypothetical protein